MVGVYAPDHPLTLVLPDREAAQLLVGERRLHFDDQGPMEALWDDVDEAALECDVTFGHTIPG